MPPTKRPAKKAASAKPALAAVPDPNDSLQEGQGSIDLDSDGEPITDSGGGPDGEPNTDEQQADLKAALDEAVQVEQDTGPRLDPLELVSIEDQDDYLNILYWGDQGTRKTTDVCTMANLGPVVVVNAEAGLKKRPLSRHGVNTANLMVFPRPGVPLTFDTLEALYWDLKAKLEDNPGCYAGVIWDSITEIHKKLLESVVIHQVEKAERAGVERERFFVDRNDYGVMSEQVRLLLRRFRDLPCHFAVTALQRRSQDDDGEVRYVPQVTPALQDDLLGFVDVVIHTRVEMVGDQEEGRGRTNPGTKFAAKDRYDVLPMVMVDPTFLRVLDYTEERLTYDTDPVQAAARERLAAIKAAKEEAKAKAEA